MSFDVPAEAYLRFMGRYSVPLSPLFLELADVRRGDRVLDVGCGPGVVTRDLVERCGAASVSAVDPSSSFVRAVEAALPGVDVKEATAEALPYDDDTFDVALAQLVVHFMRDPVAGLREMGRVTRPGGRVAASVWDHAGPGGPLSLFWKAAAVVVPGAPGEADLAGSREGHLAELAAAAGLRDVRSTSATVRIPFASFDEWWTPYLDGVGTAGGYLATLEPGQRDAIRERCEAMLPPPPFEHDATAWVVLARA